MHAPHDYHFLSLLKSIEQLIKVDGSESPRRDGVDNESILTDVKQLAHARQNLHKRSFIGPAKKKHFQVPYGAQIFQQKRSCWTVLQTAVQEQQDLAFCRCSARLVQLEARTEGAKRVADPHAILDSLFMTLRESEVRTTKVRQRKGIDSCGDI